MSYDWQKKLEELPNMSPSGVCLNRILPQTVSLRDVKKIFEEYEETQANWVYSPETKKIHCDKCQHTKEVETTFSFTNTKNSPASLIGRFPNKEKNS